MQTEISIHFQDINTTAETYVDIDMVCPHCGQPGQPILHNAVATKLFNNIENTVGLFLQCPIENCLKYSVQAFHFIKTGRDSYKIASIDSKIQYSYNPPIKNDLPQEINEKYPGFKDIYDQALEAESLGLDQIAGIGFRKSLEFLIKLYAIDERPADKDKIEAEKLGETIKTRYSVFPRIQKLAELAAWIGNDETHFIRKHTALDISDMKKFIRSAALFISAEMDASAAEKYITDQKK